MIDPKKINKILVIDHNIYRFHHYDLMESMLFYEPFFNKLKKEYSGYLTMNLDEQLMFLSKSNSERNILKFFSDESDMDEYIDILNKHIAYSGKEPLYCDLYFGLPAISSMSLVELHIIKIPTDLPYPDVSNASLKIVEHENLFDVNFLVDYIIENQIDIVICDSIDVAIGISQKTENLSFMIPNYRYNLEMVGNQLLMKHTKDIIENQLERKHNYTLFENMKGGEV